MVIIAQCLTERPEFLPCVFLMKHNTTSVGQFRPFQGQSLTSNRSVVVLHSIRKQLIIKNSFKVPPNRQLNHSSRWSQLSIHLSCFTTLSPRCLSHNIFERNPIIIPKNHSLKIWAWVMRNALQNCFFCLLGCPVLDNTIQTIFATEDFSYCVPQVHPKLYQF